MSELKLSLLPSAVTVAGALLLLLAAAAKLRTPQPSAEVLRRLRLPASAAAVRLLAASEIVIAGLALLGGVAALPLALTYAAFAAVALQFLRVAPGQSCGCFGAADSPVTRLHVVLTAGVAVAAVAQLWGRSGWTALPGDPVPAGLLALQIALLTALGYAALAVYPPLLAARKLAAIPAKAGSS